MKLIEVYKLSCVLKDKRNTKIGTEVYQYSDNFEKILKLFEDSIYQVSERMGFDIIGVEVKQHKLLELSGILYSTGKISEVEGITISRFGDISTVSDYEDYESLEKLNQDCNGKPYQDNMGWIRGIKK